MKERTETSAGMNESKTSVDRTSSSPSRHTSSHHPSVDWRMMYRHHLFPLKLWTAIHLICSQAMNSVTVK